MPESELLEDVKKYILKLFYDSLPDGTYYHNYDHTLNVVNAANEIALAEHISNGEMEILLLAAWFHDSGFIKGFENHEKKSQKIAEAYLTEKKFPKEKIKNVLSMIEATTMPQNPKNKLEKIICDADLFHLGSTNFDKLSKLLKLEREQLTGLEIANKDWLTENLDFLTNHKYFTNYAFERLNNQKTFNWLNVKNNLQKIQLKYRDTELKKIKEDKPVRGVETMFRVTHRNHMKLSDIADTKANILLSVSAIILSISLSSLFPKLDNPSNYYLIYPTFIFIFITVVTMIFSILSTRPKVTSGKFSKKDIEQKKVNLLFFGNFNNISLIDFQKGMNDMMNDSDYLYNSLIKDLYYLGKVLDKKYKLLHIAYSIFMYGIIISVIAFVIALEVMNAKVY